MAFEGLATPLGVKPREARKSSKLSKGRVAFALFCAVIAFFLTFMALHSMRRGVDPTAVAVIERIEAGGFVTPGQAPPAAPSTPPPRLAGQDIEEQAGVRVVRQQGGQAPGAAVIRVPDTASGTDRMAPAPDPRITERGPHGLVPRLGEGGLAARRLYARPFTASGKPMIAVVLTGVGISQRGTADAISRLPGEFTLAFAPYGRDLEAQALRARRDGHEILLQVPMEPQDYPENDPGPHTLRATANTRENQDRLMWLMSRFPGYVGVMNYMGGKLVASEPSFRPLLEEMAKRGMLFLDDGSNRRSLTGDLAPKLNLPFVRGDRVVEATGASLRAVLAEVEALAGRNGRAVVSVPALPANIEMLMQWEADLKSKGIVLAPVSALASVKQ